MMRMAIATFTLGDAAAWPIQGLIRNFRDETEDRIRHKRSTPTRAVAAE